MEDKLTEIEKICGLKPDNIQFKIIENDPNFIFEPNPSFEKITLYYPDNNPIKTKLAKNKKKLSSKKHEKVEIIIR